MRHTPIHLIVAQTKRIKYLADQIHYLRRLIKDERPYSVRRNELESLLRGKIAKQLKREIRGAA